MIFDGLLTKRNYSFVVLCIIPRKLNTEMLDRISVSVEHRNHNYFSGSTPLSRITIFKERGSHSSSYSSYETV